MSGLRGAKVRCPNARFPPFRDTPAGAKAGLRQQLVPAHLSIELGGYLVVIAAIQLITLFQTPPITPVDLSRLPCLRRVLRSPFTP
jgi:hypothetical protein